MQGSFRDALQQLFGEYTLSRVAGSLRVIAYDPVGGICILRCSREDHAKVCGQRDRARAHCAHANGSEIGMGESGGPLLGRGSDVECCLARECNFVPNAEHGACIHLMRPPNTLQLWCSITFVTMIASRIVSIRAVKVSGSLEAAKAAAREAGEITISGKQLGDAHSKLHAAFLAKVDAMD